MSLKANLKFNEQGLIPAVVQDSETGDVLMLGYMNEESIRRTLSSGEVWFYSRSRQELWHKGATSGNRLIVRELWQDCDPELWPMVEDARQRIARLAGEPRG